MKKLINKGSGAIVVTVDGKQYNVIGEDGPAIETAAQKAQIQSDLEFFPDLELVGVTQKKAKEAPVAPAATAKTTPVEKTTETAKAAATPAKEAEKKETTK